MQAMQALPCPKGTYKEGINRASVCTPCPKGISTAGVASSSGTACDRALPGYKPVRSSGPAGAVILTTEPCPKGTYGPDGLKCITCNDNLTTQVSSGPCAPAVLVAVLRADLLQCCLLAASAAAAQAACACKLAQNLHAACS